MNKKIEEILDFTIMAYIFANLGLSFDTNRFMLDKEIIQNKYMELLKKEL